MPSVLLSGAEQQVADVAKALRDGGATVTEVVDIHDVPRVCEQAGGDAFDVYVQLGATFRIEGATAIQRVEHFYAEGVLARFRALDAALGALTIAAQVIFVLGTLPPEVATDDDREARRALTRVLGRAAQADAAPGDLTVRLLGSDTEPERIAALALGRPPSPQDPEERLAGLSLEDWRVELMSVVLVET
jgi:hypothetical protein